MGAAAEENKFYWVPDAEPHARRRRQMLAKYGDQVRALYGYDVSTAYQARPATGAEETARLVQTTVAPPSCNWSSFPGN